MCFHYAGYEPIPKMKRTDRKPIIKSIASKIKKAIMFILWGAYGRYGNPIDMGM